MTEEEIKTKPPLRKARIIIEALLLSVKGYD
jgi:hypothetical protein